MAEHITTVTQKGQVTIPAELRRVLRLKPRDRVALELVNGAVFLRRAESAVLASYGAVKPLKPAGEPIDSRRLRREIEEEIADEVAREA